jgi:hypothetical protein
LKVISVELSDRPIIEVETGFWIFKRGTKFEAVSHQVAEYYNWVRLPDRTVVPDGLFFQLNSWLADAKRGLIP